MTFESVSIRSKQTGLQAAYGHAKTNVEQEDEWQQLYRSPANEKHNDVPGALMLQVLFRQSFVSSSQNTDALGACL